MFCLKTWSFLLGAFSVQGERYALSILAFPLVLCVFRGGRRFLRIELRGKILEPTALKSKIQHLKSII
ncbi:hypothetical protein PG294_10180 [Riemerella anatipestifer]|uniref:hypothetical protein n=1 Tax=Riemerella anatipestifer TaxID=34085 RepID=UPI000AE4B445|nr:hypothetical protein [Riemerella anatipestifer]MBT0574019.1 hypothetical protein [Riemerella anatipestifer]MCQ4155949.1 hypothetical protein [Riemerella anatipestifer]MDD1539579.1 hypothetical protein [Riemerella anatipestifer]MDR7776053.1 hypothetical protein [Riemerella anatipestifer]MDR7784671.1 hypothetical protein [Riemerella anatipestifer]